MIRHTCAACGRPINRTDRLFESSDGTHCQACRARLGAAMGKRRPADGRSMAWTCLPPLAQPASAHGG